MPSHSLISYLMVGLFYLNSGFSMAAEIPKTLKIFGDQYLHNVAQQEVFVLAVLTQNTLKTDLEVIKRLDAKWQKTTGIDPFMWDLMRNDCAFELSNFLQTYPFISEAFVMDNQGALVCLTHKTTDYWQGDEVKFTDAYLKGQGSIYYGDIKYDSSTDEVLM